MSKLVILICILCSAIVCQAENCTIKYSVNGTEDSEILVHNGCNVLSDIFKNKIENGISLKVNYSIEDIGMQDFLDEKEKYVSRITYEITLNNTGTPELDEVTLEATLCDGLVYEGSEFKESMETFYIPTVIQNSTTHTTKTVIWWIGKVSPGELRTVSLKALYLSTKAPEELSKTVFKMKAKLWNEWINKKNDKMEEIG
jgi:hypothetical protein